MKFLLRYIIVLFALSVTHAAAQSLKIGYVNGVRIEKESAITVRALEQAKKDFAQREQQVLELQKQGQALQSEIEKEGLTMAAADKQAKEKRLAVLAQQFGQMQRSYNEDWEMRRREAHARLVAEVNIVIKGIAEAGKFDLIVQQAVFNSPQIDITEQVLKELAKRAGSAVNPGK